MEKKKKNLILGLVLVLLLLVVGVAYAFFTYENTGQKSEVVTGQIYMNYEETNVLTLTNVWPETKAQALARQDEHGVFEFTITGQNTSREDIEYVIKIDEANDISGKNRISNKFIRIYLESEGEVLVDGEIFNKWDNRVITIATVPAGTPDRISKTYALRMWIDENISISDTAPNADYTTSEWNNSYANLRINVYGKTGGISKPLATEIEETQPLTTADAYGNRYVTGTNADITNNYVKFSNRLWRIVGINSDGTIKLITESAMTFMPWDSTGNTDYATSEIREWLNEEFLPTLNEDMIAETTYNYTGITNSFVVGDIEMLQDKVGLLSAFDYLGVNSADLTTGNFGYMTDNYLINGQGWWLTTYSQEVGQIWGVTPKAFASVIGKVSVNYQTPTNYDGVRPVVNLLSTTNFIEGDGSKENPYVIEGEETKGEIYQYNEKLVTELSNLSEPDLNGTRYVTGLVEDNYVQYSGKEWRIVALNGDGTVKLVTQDALTSIEWDINGNNNYATSQMRRWLNNEFLPTLNEKKLLATSTLDYGYGTLDEKVGLLTINDFYASGGSNYSDTSKTYLKTKYSWWTMTPYTVENNASKVWCVTDSGTAFNGDTTATSIGARPSVNLISDIRILGGTGIQLDKYKIFIDNEV